MKAQVLLPKVFNYPFTYDSNTECKIGDLVEIPFGSKRAIGVIWKNNYFDPKNLKLKKIIKITEYSIDRKLVDFIEWFSSYNMVPLGLVLKMVIGGTDKFLRIKDSLIKIKKKKIKKFKLNEEQNTALEYLQKVNNKFDVSVLQGTTGSGKTLVYFQRIKKIIEKNEQALVLLPEIFLTNDFKSRFEDYFGFEPAIWHSKISVKKKKNIVGANNKIFLKNSWNNYQYFQFEIDILNNKYTDTKKKIIENIKKWEEKQFWFSICNSQKKNLSPCKNF